ncbi:SUKH-4 family immunity protein [Actinocorallia populi]|uniref:SUKH-4 family immunity protein n=1 Tax=Actinocorallia populi TaxID=2079200 RepID=UPI000D09246C|nr:SUKH-4 family immunity protein [Actinocorallia populi]
MSETGAVVSGCAPHPLIVHEPTRRALAPGERLDGRGLVSFHPLGGPSLSTVRERVAALDGDPSELDEDLAELLLIGHLIVEGDEEGEEVVLDGGTGRVFSMWLYAKSPDGAELFPLAPSVGALLGFLAAVDDFRRLRGRFAALAGRTGPEAVREAERLLTEAFTEEEWGEDGWGPAGPRSGWEHPLPALWRIAAVIRPLGLIAGPGRGLALDLPDELFDAEEKVRLTDDRLPPVLVHPQTRRFLTEVGLPEDGFMFYGPDPGPLPTLPEDWADSQSRPEHAHLWRGDERLPLEAEHLVVLGGLVHDFTVLIDGRTGALFHTSLGSGQIVPVNADISTLVFTLWLHRRERELDEEHDFTQDFYHQLADTMVEVLASVDPVACRPAEGPDDYRYWPEVFHDEAGGVL